MSKTFRFTSQTLDDEKRKMKRVKFNRKNTDCGKCRWRCRIQWIPMRNIPPYINKDNEDHHFLFWATTECQPDVISRFDLFNATEEFADMFLSVMLHLIKTDSIHFPLPIGYKDDMVGELTNRDTNSPTFTITGLEAYFREFS